MNYQDLCTDCQAKSKEKTRIANTYRYAENAICEILDRTGFSAGDVEIILNDIQRKIRREKEAATIQLATPSTE